MGKNFVIVGGGISGLVAALLIARRGAGRVTVVEREATVGGLLRCFDYGEWGRFDYGMHNMDETGIDALDALLFGLLPEGEWQLLEGHKRDLAGVYFRHGLQLNSVFADVRRLPANELRACRESFDEQARAGFREDTSSALAYARGRFGPRIADEVIAPAVQKQFRRPAAEMDTLAMLLTSMTRVVMYDDPPFGEMMKSDVIRERLAYPEQRKLPGKYLSRRRGYYPKRHGMQAVIDALGGQLQELGVEVATSSTVTGIEVRGQTIDAVMLAAPSGQRRIEGISRLVWTTSLPAAAPLLGIDVARLPFDRPLGTVVVSLLLRRPPAMADLYYFYCYDAGFATFRVTNYTGYCAGAPRAGLFPIAVELLLDRDEVARGDAVERATRELQAFGVIGSPGELAFARAEVLAAGFPMPTLRNVSSSDAIRAGIARRKLGNFMSLGILSVPRLFFQKDVLAHTYRSLEGAGLA